MVVYYCKNMFVMFLLVNDMDVVDVVENEASPSEKTQMRNAFSSFAEN